MERSTIASLAGVKRLGSGLDVGNKQSVGSGNEYARIINWTLRRTDMKPPVSKDFWIGIRNVILPSLLLWALIIWGICALCGCDQRLTRYYKDPNMIEIEYKSNRLASDEQIDSIIVKTPDNWLIYVGVYRLDNDSFKVLTPYGTLESEE